jgi:histidinol-phosphate phosphatase family protein
MAVGALAVIAGVGRHRRLAAAAAALWAVATLQFFGARARSGPRDLGELASLAVTSALIPPLAVAHRLRGELRVLRESRAGLPPSARLGPRRRPRAVLFDRDGTLVVDVPYNGDPDAVAPVDGASEALAALRDAGVRLAVVTNQSAIGRGMVSRADVDAVHRRIQALVGPIEHWFVCPHTEDHGCGCRKPSPGLVFAAASRLRVLPSQCVVIGDTEADVAAGRRAGARGILVPNPRTRGQEVAVAPETALTLTAAVELVLGAA